uniref:Uncharacterized protein n=1 Tax=Anguilla anguilla TaxID=7936 RepID=A0A0E9PVA9_ANGAN
MMSSLRAEIKKTLILSAPECRAQDLRVREETATQPER